MVCHPTDTPYHSRNITQPLCFDAKRVSSDYQPWFQFQRQCLLTISYIQIIYVYHIKRIRPPNHLFCSGNPKLTEIGVSLNGFIRFFSTNQDRFCIVIVNHNRVMSGRYRYLSTGCRQICTLLFTSSIFRIKDNLHSLR